MTSTDLATTTTTADPPALRITAKVRTAIDAMVWSGLNRADAAAAAGITEHGLYKAFRKPHVKAFYLAECEVLRTSGKARRIHRLAEIADSDKNLNASVAAIRAAEGLADTHHAQPGAGFSMPGFIVQIITPQAHRPMLDVTPIDAEPST